MLTMRPARRAILLSRRLAPPCRNAVASFTSSASLSLPSARPPGWLMDEPRALPVSPAEAMIWSQAPLPGNAVIRSTVDTGSDEFRQNHALMSAAMAEVETLTRRVHQGGDARAREKHLARGKMLPRDRVAALVDPGSTFLELATLAGHGLYPEADVPAAGLVAGVGVVEGKPCMIFANDSTVKGGTYFPITVKKHLRMQEIAMENHLPCIYLVDSGGANLPHQAELFPDRDGFGRIFKNQARMSSMGIPQISAVMGPCTAGGAYVPAMSDETAIVKNQGHIFLAGPPLVKAATGEEITAEELGGGAMHTSQSGVADYLAVDESHALEIVRRCAALFNPYFYMEQPTTTTTTHNYAEPAYAAEELLGIASTNLRKPLPMREVIARVVDGSEMAEFKPDYGTTLVAGFARICDRPVGILGNDGILFSDSALKGTHFIQLCAQRGTPLVFLQNISGFMVGSAAEREGIAKNGAKLVNAVACADVPKFTVVVGGSFGAGNYGMCGRAFDPRFMWMWPNARIGVMGSEQLAAVMRTVRGGGKEKKSGEKEEEKAGAEEVDPLQARIERESEAIYSTARLWDDGIIPPSHTRRYLGMALAIAKGGGYDKLPGSTKYGVFRM